MATIIYDQKAILTIIVPHELREEMVQLMRRLLDAKLFSLHLEAIFLIEKKLQLIELNRNLVEAV